MKTTRPSAKIAAITAGLFIGVSAQATIVSGSVTTGTGTFIRLSPGFTDSTPDNTVGNNTFQNTNLYGFDEDQNVQVVGSPLNVDWLTSSSAAGSLAVGTVVASHYIFFDPFGATRQVGTVSFDSEVLAILTSTANLLASDYLANTGVTYLNPSARGLEGSDSVTVSGPNEITVDWFASSPGDYIRVLTAFSPGAEDPGTVPEPDALFLSATALLAALGVRRRRPRGSA